MDDLESMFGLLLWLCVHYHDPSGKFKKSERHEGWNFSSPGDLAQGKLGLINWNKEYFLSLMKADPTDHYKPLWIYKLKLVEFPSNSPWTQEDPSLYDRMRDVLKQAMQDPEVNPDRPKFKHGYATRSKGPIKGT